MSSSSSSPLSNKSNGGGVGNLKLPQSGSSKPLIDWVVAVIGLVADNNGGGGGGINIDIDRATEIGGVWQACCWILGPACGGLLCKPLILTVPQLSGDNFTACIGWWLIACCSPDAVQMNLGLCGCILAAVKCCGRGANGGGGGGGGSAAGGSWLLNDDWCCTAVGRAVLT